MPVPELMTQEAAAAIARYAGVYDALRVRQGAPPGVAMCKFEKFSGVPNRQRVFSALFSPIVGPNRICHLSRRRFAASANFCTRASTKISAVRISPLFGSITATVSPL
jgi:hypothetical protein